MPGAVEYWYVYLLLAAVALAVFVAWIFLPFAMFGTKDILREILEEQRRTNEILEGRLPALRPPVTRDRP